MWIRGIGCILASGVWIVVVVFCLLASVRAEEEEMAGDTWPTAVSGERSSSEGEEMVNLNFEDADIRAVIHSFAKALGFSYVPDPGIQGKVTIRTTEPVPKQDLWPLFHHILRSNGLAAVKEGDIYQIIPMGEAKTRLLFSGPEREEAEGEGGFVVELVKVKHMAVGDMVNTIQPFVSPGGEIITYAPGNLLIITDLAANVQRLKDVIAAFDTVAARESFTRVYRIRHANVEKLGEEVKQVLAASGANGLSVVPFPRLNSMVVISSNPEVFPQVQRWIEELDIPVAVNAARETRTRLYRLKHANVEKLGEGIKQVLAASGITSEDAKENSVSVVLLPSLNSVAIITSDPEVFPEVQKRIEELDIPIAISAAKDTHTRLYRLKHANVEKLGEEIKQVLAASGVMSEDAKENGVFVVPVPRLNSVAVITSDPGVLPQVQKWIEELDVPVASDLRLVGVFIVPGQEEALLLDSSQDGKKEILRVKIGGEVGRYRLSKVERTKVVLSGPSGDEVSLPLNVFPGEEATKAARMEVAPVQVEVVAPNSPAPQREAAPPSPPAPLPPPEQPPPEQ